MDSPAHDEHVIAEAVLLGVAALCITAVAVPACMVVARRTGIMDRPGALKTQETPVPYLGGVAVFAGAAVGISVGRPIVLVPLCAALGVGVADDRFDLPAPVRLVAQLGVGGVIAATQPVHLPGWLGTPLVLAVTVILINGFNLIDGLDMLAAGVGAAGAVGFAVVVHGDARLMAASVAGALVAFLWFNRPQARIYLGDGGSYLLGAAMTVLLTQAWGVGVAGPTGVAALALLAVAVAEVVCAIVRRHRGGLSLLSGDRGHPYDRLVDRGWSRTAASATYIAVEVTVAVAVAVTVLVGHVSMTAALGLDGAVAAAVLVGGALAGGMADPTGTRS
jgi:UDP-GlcNAc:undecaprenyl-phosphate/decaprenyl-phosphate GlcNAc-1-phosphate transferase